MKMKNYFFIFYALFAFNFEIAFGAECDEKSKPIDCYQYAIEKLQMAVSQIKNLEKQMTDLAKVQKEIASLKEELKAQETRIDAKFQKETASLKEELKAQEIRGNAKLQQEIASFIPRIYNTVPKIYKTSVVAHSYYECNGNINPGSEVRVEFPKNYFSRVPEVMIAIRGWSYYGGLSTDSNQLKHGRGDQGAGLQMGPSWAKISEVTKDYCKIQIYLHEVALAYDNQFLLDVLAVTN